jgi:hypothetical protein
MLIVRAPPDSEGAGAFLFDNTVHPVVVGVTLGYVAAFNVSPVNDALKTVF